MKVRALRTGYYGNSRKKEGAVFHIKSEELFSDKWMEKVEDKPLKKVTKKVSKKSPTKDEEVI